jgi:DNA-binding IclR family transcriptional regulator
MSSVRRSVQVIDLLARKGPLGVRAVAEQLSLPLGSVHRLLIDLAEEDVVERTPEGRWDLSHKLLEITSIQLSRLEFPRLVRPFCERIAEATGETANVNALSGLSAVCVDKVRGNEGMQLDWPIGSRGPLYCGGAGKAILAFLTEAEQQRVLQGPLTPFTVNTVTRSEVLKTELARIRERGYSIDDQEIVMGVYCLSMPIFGRTARPVGAVSITGPKPKRPGPEIEPFVAMLSEACSYVSRRLGFVGSFSFWERARPAAKKRTASAIVLARREAL